MRLSISVHVRSTGKRILKQTHAGQESRRIITIASAPDTHSDEISDRRIDRGIGPDRSASFRDRYRWFQRVSCFMQTMLSTEDPTCYIPCRRFGSLTSRVSRQYPPAPASKQISFTNSIIRTSIDGDPGRRSDPAIIYRGSQRQSVLHPV